MRLLVIDIHRRVERVWPVSMAFDFARFDILRRHDNDGDSLLDDHLPEVVSGVRHGALTGDVCTLLPAHTRPDVACVDVVFAASQHHPCRVVCKPNTSQILTIVLPLSIRCCETINLLQY